MDVFANAPNQNENEFVIIVLSDTIFIKVGFDFILARSPFLIAILMPFLDQSVLARLIALFRHAWNKETSTKVFCVSDVLLLSHILCILQIRIQRHSPTT